MYGFYCHKIRQVESLTGGHSYITLSVLIQSIASYKANSTDCDLLLSISDIFIFSWKASSISLRPLPRLQFLYPSFSNVFWKAVLHNTLPIHLTLVLCIVCRKLFLCRLSVIFLHFSHDLSNWYYPSFPSTQFQNFQRYLWFIFRNVHLTAP
jgi:hypothetical protein